MQASSIHPQDQLAAYWGADWLWGLPLLVGTVIFHVCVFVLMERALFLLLGKGDQRRGSGYRIVAIAVIALAAAMLHSLEATAWAILYLFLGALPNVEVAMLYSLSAITDYGHAAVYLEARWKLLGAIEAMNGLILFGLTTAFLFAAIEMARRDHQR
jgi:hypothetical protein